VFRSLRVTRLTILRHIAADVVLDANGRCGSGAAIDKGRANRVAGLRDALIFVSDYKLLLFL
jgi:hypothetical protein